MAAVDRAVEAAWPERKGDAYVRAMQAAAAELEAIASVMQAVGSDPVEQSRTQRSLGCVYGDLGPALGKAMLQKAYDCFLRAEGFLTGRSETLEQAKIDFNIGNMLRQIDASDTVLLQEAERRLLAARPVFEVWAPENLSSVDQALVSARALLKFAPLASSVNRRRSDLDQLDADIAKGKSATELAKKLEDIGGGLRSAVEGLGPLLDSRRTR